MTVGNSSGIALPVIVPIYNRATYLPLLLPSLQTLRQAEVIFVDDGSTDRSAEIVQAYLSGFSLASQIKLAHGGVSKARNVGLAVARGRYITFVDVDDAVDSGCIE